MRDRIVDAGYMTLFGLFVLGCFFDLFWFLRGGGDALPPLGWW